jgi:hypothetical protein
VRTCASRYNILVRIALLFGLPDCEQGRFVGGVGVRRAVEDSCSQVLFWYVQLSRHISRGQSFAEQRDNVTSQRAVTPATEEVQEGFEVHDADGGDVCPVSVSWVTLWQAFPSSSPERPNIQDCSAGRSGERSRALSIAEAAGIGE